MSIQNLNKTFSEISEKLYKDSQNQEGAAKEPSATKESESKADEVKDADYEVVEDESDGK